MQTPAANSDSAWKVKAYVFAIIGGVLFGLASGYLYTRAAQENRDLVSGKPTSISTGQLLGLGLTAFGLVRQITALGETPKGKGRK
jgi:H+/Cl- antiporter ClcA